MPLRLVNQASIHHTIGFFFKSMIHFLTQEERLAVFEGFYKQLAPKNGKLVIVYGSNKSDHLPFDERTKDLFQSTLGIETSRF
jgi:hypothetical protein